MRVSRRAGTQRSFALPGNTRPKKTFTASPIGVSSQPKDRSSERPFDSVAIAMTVGTFSAHEIAVDDIPIDIEGDFQFP